MTPKSEDDTGSGQKGVVWVRVRPCTKSPFDSGERQLEGHDYDSQGSPDVSSVEVM